MPEPLPRPQPVFTLYTTDGDIKIYANGAVEGWVENWPKLKGISNHLPWLLNADQLSRFSLKISNKQDRGKPK